MSTVAVNRGENTNRAILLSMVMSLAAKMLNFGQSVVVSYAFGTSESTDILFYSLSMIILLTTFQGAVNHQVIIPVSIGLRKNRSEEHSKRFMSYVFFIYLCMGFASVVLLLLSPADIIAALSRFPKAAITNNLGIIRLIVPSMFLIILNTYMLDIFTSYKYFTFPMVLDILKNLIIIVTVLAFKGFFREESLALGILAGNAAQFVVLNILLRTKIKLRFSFRRYKISREIKKNMMFVITGRVSTMANDFAMIYLLSGFSAGIFSAMDYAFKIDTVLNMVIVGQITTVVGIKIMELHSAGKLEELKQVFLGYLERSLFFMIPICAIISLNAAPIISLLLQRGNFNGEDVGVTAMFLRYFVLTVPLELVNGFMVILIIAKQIQRVAFRWQIFQSLLNIGIVWAAVSNFGYKGYPVAVLASFLAYILLMVCFLVRAEFGYIGPLAVLKPYFANVVLNGLAFGLVYFSFRGVDFGGGFMENLLRIVTVSFSYGTAFLAISWFSGLGKAPLREVWGLLRRLPGGRRHEKPEY